MDVRQNSLSLVPLSRQCALQWFNTEAEVLNSRYGYKLFWAVNYKNIILVGALRARIYAPTVFVC